MRYLAPRSKMEFLLRVIRSTEGRRSSPVRLGACAGLLLALTFGICTQQAAAGAGAPRAPEAGPSPSCARAPGLRPGPKEPVRFGTFNIRWFPDGGPGKKPRSQGGTDLDGLACEIAAARTAALSVQELKTTPHARAALGQVMARLDQLTGGSWRAVLDQCPLEAVQHVGILYDSRRLTAVGQARMLASLNPHGQACEGSLRPGLAQRLRLPGGALIDLVSVHFKSGADARSRGLRRRSVAALLEIPREEGVELVVAGDFNTMGCADCEPAESPRAERTWMAGAISPAGAATPSASLHFVEPPAGCSHYHRGRGELLDGFLVSEGLVSGASAEAKGFCARTQCGALDAEARALQHEVSDHCPLALSFATL